MAFNIVVAVLIFVAVHIGFSYEATVAAVVVDIVVVVIVLVDVVLAKVVFCGPACCY